MHTLCLGLGTQHRACALIKTETDLSLPWRSQFGGRGRPATRQVTYGDKQSCDGDVQGTVQKGLPRWGRSDTGLAPGPELPDLYLGVAVFQAHCCRCHCMEARGRLQGDMGKRPREGRTGWGGNGRSSATIPWILDNPETGIHSPGCPDNMDSLSAYCEPGFY